jgi:hypothetical protein
MGQEEDWGNCNSNGVDTSKRGNGDGGDRLQWHWGTGARATEQCCNKTVIAIAMAMGRWRRCVCFISRINVMDCG